MLYCNPFYFRNTCRIQLPAASASCIECFRASNTDVQAVKCANWAYSFEKSKLKSKHNMSKIPLHLILFSQNHGGNNYNGQQ
jgi:hypothetical protein